MGFDWYVLRNSVIDRFRVYHNIHKSREDDKKYKRIKFISISIPNIFSIVQNVRHKSVHISLTM